MTGKIVGNGQGTYQRGLWWITALGLLLLVAGGTLLMIIVVVVARTSGKEPIRGTGGWALASAPKRTAANQSTSNPNDSFSSAGESSQNDFAPGAALLEPAARQAMVDGSARLVIEAIGVDAPILPVGLMEMQEDGRKYSQWQVPDDYAVGWHRTSAGLGLPGNMVLNGHNNAHGAVFRDLGELGFGEEIVLYHGQQAHRYQVVHRELLEENKQPLSARLDNAKWMLPTSDERLTLISCWPHVGTTHRLIVIATPTNGD
jgi:LPXTG-site transpeptidase (sortase) family protein